MTKDTTEIFDTARAYAIQTMIHDNTTMLNKSYPHEIAAAEGEGAKRLHHQALKVLTRAFHNAVETKKADASGEEFGQNIIEAFNKLPLGAHTEAYFPSFDEVSAEINTMEDAFAMGWNQDDDGFVYKDFDENTRGRLMETLNFIKKDLHVTLSNQDCPGPLAEAQHIKLTVEDYHKIFNPRTHYETYERERGDDGLQI